MTREQIIAAAKAGGRRATSKGFAATPVQQRHKKRLEELKRRAELDRKQNEEALRERVHLSA
jgi:hypothetical protein